MIETRNLRKAHCYGLLLGTVNLYAQVCGLLLSEARM